MVSVVHFDPSGFCSKATIDGNVISVRHNHIAPQGMAKTVRIQGDLGITRKQRSELLRLLNTERQKWQRTA